MLPTNKSILFHPAVCAFARLTRRGADVPNVEMRSLNGAVSAPLFGSKAIQFCASFSSTQPKYESCWIALYLLVVKARMCRKKENDSPKILLKTHLIGQIQSRAKKSTATCEELSWREEKERNPQITKVGREWEEREGGRQTGRFRFGPAMNSGLGDQVLLSM